MKEKINLGARIILGLIFFVFGINGFLKIIPLPEHPEAANIFLASLGMTGYFMPVVKITEIVAGAMLLSGYFVPLGLVLLAPIVVQIFLFHVFLAPGGMIMAIVLVVLEGYLGFFVYRESFRSVLAAKPS